MRSNKYKEFYAELKVLCKIQHINIVSDTSDDVFFDIVLRVLMFEYKYLTLTYDLSEPKLDP